MFQLVTSGNKSVRQWFPMISKYGDESKKKISMKVVHGKERTSWHQADMSYKKYKAQIPVNIIYLILKFQYSKPARFPTEFGAVTVFATRRTTSLSKLTQHKRENRKLIYSHGYNKQTVLLTGFYFQLTVSLLSGPAPFQTSGSSLFQSRTAACTTASSGSTSRNPVMLTPP